MPFKIEEVTLYRSGVGFFTGKCDEQEFVLPVNEEDVDDVLKSLSVEGLKSVTFSAAEEKENIHKKIGVRVDSEAALKSLCNHLVGLEVEVEADQGFQGVIIGVDFILLEETSEEESGVDVLVLRDDKTIYHIPLSGIKRLKLLDDAIKKDLQVYLDLEASTRKVGVTNLKVLTLQKDATMQWVIPVSAWRLSYRVQFEENSGKAQFTGIAIVDNTTSIDWEDVQLRLVTGRPVSFRYDLHTPLYVDRPWVSRDEKGISPIMAQAAMRMDKQVRSGIATVASSSDMPMAPPGGVALRAEAKGDWGIAREVMKIDTLGMPEELGATVTYLVQHPVSISRSESSLIPLFSESMKGELCIVIRDDRINEAMDALLFKKSIDLEKGVATIYIEEIFAGDAMVVRGTDYIAFRLNQDVHIIKQVESESKITKVSVRKNLLYQTSSEIVTMTFKLLYLGDEKIPLILEIGKMSGYDPEEKPVKETPSYHRFRIELEPGTQEKTYKFTKEYSTSIYIRNMSEESVKELIAEGLLDEKGQKKVLEIFAILKEIAKKEKEQSEIEDEIQWEYKNQERLRKNIKMLQEINQTKVRKEYIERLKESERLLENLEAERKKLSTEVALLRKKI